MPWPPPLPRSDPPARPRGAGTLSTLATLPSYTDYNSKLRVLILLILTVTPLMLALCVAWLTSFVFQIGVDHHFDQLPEVDLRFPAKLCVRFGGIADQERDVPGRKKRWSWTT